jgi:hypothetical protein
MVERGERALQTILLNCEMLAGSGSFFFSRFLSFSQTLFSSAQGGAFQALAQNCGFYTRISEVIV